MLHSLLHYLVRNELAKITVHNPGNKIIFTEFEMHTEITYFTFAKILKAFGWLFKRKKISKRCRINIMIWSGMVQHSLIISCRLKSSSSLEKISNATSRRQAQWGIGTRPPRHQNLRLVTKTLRLCGSSQFFGRHKLCKIIVCMFIHLYAYAYVSHSFIHRDFSHQEV